MANADDDQELLDSLFSLLEDVPESAHGRAGDFFESVDEKARSMQEYLDARGSFTYAQREALENMKRGVSKWIR